MALLYMYFAYYTGSSIHAGLVVQKFKTTLKSEVFVCAHLCIIPCRHTSSASVMCNMVTTAAVSLHFCKVWRSQASGVVLIYELMYTHSWTLP